jgi:hypothetical protein
MGLGALLRWLSSLSLRTEPTEAAALPVDITDEAQSSLASISSSAPPSSSSEPLGSLPPELLVEIFSRVDARTLLNLSECCREWRSVEQDNTLKLWSPVLQATYPLFTTHVIGADACRWAKQAYMLADGGSTFDVQLINSQLRAGMFGSASIATARYGRRVGREDEATSSRLWVDCGRVGAVAGTIAPTPEGRARKPSGVTHEFASMATPFTSSLEPGMVVELQWKKSLTSPRFAWWFALVHRIVSPDCVELLFPQYGGASEDTGGPLTGVSRIDRLQLTSMHGGVAGGIRLPTPAQVDQWWVALSTDSLDVRPASSQTEDWIDTSQNDGLESWGQFQTIPGERDNRNLAPIRARFRQHLPAGQPALSQRLARVERARMSS